jgi:hypothetical protein
MTLPLRSLALWLAAGVLAACSSSASDGSSAPLAAMSGETIVLGDPDDARWPADPLTIESAQVKADTLVATVVHGGGCRDHGYQVVVSTTWMESFPVQVSARVSHDANGDACKALLRRELRVSLAPLAQAYRDAYRQTNGSIVLRLAGSPSGLVYTF